MASIADFVSNLADDPQDPGARKDFPLMPEGQAYDMGHAPDGTPLFDPRILDSYEFMRNPYPYYRMLRDHYPVFHDKLHNTYWVTRYDDVSSCYFDDECYNTIPKGSSSGVLGNTQLELSGIEHRRRRNLYGQHLVGQALKARVPSIQRLAREMIDNFEAIDDEDVLSEKNGVRTLALGAAFANEFPIRVVCEVLGFPEEARTEAHKVRGCVSQVWLNPHFSDDTPPKITFDGDSDAHIVRGLVVLMMLLFNGKTGEEILKTDAKGVLEHLGLSRHLSPMRTNGLFSMLGRIQELAKSHA